MRKDVALTQLGQTLSQGLKGKAGSNIVKESKGKNRDRGIGR